MISSKLQAKVDQWLKWDPNATTRDEISALVAASDTETLSARLCHRISFGTAGLRGRMRAGFDSMNELTVIQASQGLCTHLLSLHASPSIVIGYDGRHQSRRFARLAAAVMLSKGIKVYWYEGVVATPLVAFGTLELRTQAGIMVTASHNPKEDNGYKVYWNNGCQIVSPIDKAIAAAIDANLEPWPVQYEAVCSAAQDDGLLVAGALEGVAAAYKARVAALTTRQFVNGALSAQHPIVFTAMHGVGRRWVAEAFDAFGFAPYVAVKEQIDPDPEFPTVVFPNPEEGAGALRLAFITAERARARLVLANDPDSDRLAVAERIAAYADVPPLLAADASDTQTQAIETATLSAHWRVFTGNDIGILLAAYSLDELATREPAFERAKTLVVNTTVSSKMLKALADKEGLRYVETLTGFKWIGSVAIRLIADEGLSFLFGFEEAIGNMVGDICFDKDGVRGAAVFAEMALRLYDAGATVASRLAALGDKYGHYAQRNGYFFCYERETMAAIFGKLREKYPTAVGQFKITGVRDLTTGYDNTQPDNKPILPVSASSHMITFYFENGAVCTLRGSGTEPKLKYYIEACASTADQARATLNELADNLIEQMLEPEKNNLKN